MNKLSEKEIINFFAKNKIWEYVNILKEIFIKYNVKHYFVGGAVRDGIIFLLNKKQRCQIQDIDIVICNKELNFLTNKIKSLKKFEEAKINMYSQFFTASIILENCRIDLSCPRKERYSFYGALPIVSKGTIDEDLFRRDFTINSIALIYDYNSNCYKFYDPFCGIKDVEEGLIRILHKKSFFDDPTRIIRAIRFAISLGYRIEKNTEKFLVNAVNKNFLDKISKDRLMNEFIYILKKCDDLVSVIRIFKKYDIIKSYSFISDFMELLEKFGSKLNLGSFNISKEDRYFIRLLFLVEKLFVKSNFYNCRVFIKQKLNLLRLRKEEKTKINNAIDFLYYDKKCNYKWLNIYVKIFNKKIFKPLITSKDLFNLGIKPGPIVGEILLKIKKLQHNGRLKTKMQAINFVKQLLRLR